MKVLLVSPVATLDGAGGDVTYTETLVANPPPGIEYETYDAALARGALRERGTGRATKALIAGRDWKRLPGETALTAISKSVNLLRWRRRLYWEPFWFFEVKPGEYDLVHAHIFNARFEGLDCPLVVSCGGPLRHLYIDARRYSASRAGVLDRADARIGRALRVNVADKTLSQAQRTMVYSQRARREVIARSRIPADRIDVVPTFQPAPPLPQPPMHAPFRVGFVARDWENKGGDTLLRAWPRVLEQRPDAHLTIAGTPRPSVLPPPEHNIEWLAYIPREQLLNELIPSFDVFAYPTKYDYLPCYTLLEVMARGVPIAGSDHRDMDITLGAIEKGTDGVAGLMAPVGDADALAANILRLLEPETNARFRRGARQHFESKFSRETVLPLLSECYAKAMQFNTTKKK